MWRVLYVRILSDIMALWRVGFRKNLLRGGVGRTIYGYRIDVTIGVVKWNLIKIIWTINGYGGCEGC
jgi:hypothetical protein